MFHFDIKTMELPHTATVAVCHFCSATGKTVCTECDGRGKKQCICCGGLGRVFYYDSYNQCNMSQTCIACFGSGRVMCANCLGQGEIICTDCCGNKKIKKYTELKVTFENHLEKQIVNRSDIPDYIIDTEDGKLVFEQTEVQINPITTYTVPEVNSTSSRIVNEHKNTFHNERVIKQRQQLRAVPVTEVHLRRRTLVHATGSMVWRGMSTPRTIHNSAAGAVPFCKRLAKNPLRGA
ncbi:protein SSUH2 homolog [Saccostrea cucullata]|uniref:protein SSUH2 homolog n=1 Tax=Saccostrea cuccullata TaxID=36930 RepID=UPI002ED02605